MSYRPSWRQEYYPISVCLELCQSVVDSELFKIVYSHLLVVKGFTQVIVKLVIRFEQLVPLTDDLAVEQVNESAELFHFLLVFICLTFELANISGGELAFKQLLLVKSKLHLTSCACYYGSSLPGHWLLLI